MAEYSEIIAESHEEDVSPLTAVSTDIRQRFEAEMRSCVAAVDELLVAPPSSWMRLTGKDPRFGSPGVVRLLLEKAYGAFDSAPTRCREICALAARLADTIDAGAVPVPELRVEAYKDLANITRKLGDAEEALRLLDVADRAAATCSVDPDFQHALVKFARSLILTDLQRWSAALDELLAARTVFEDADRRRFVLTYHQESIIVAQSGDALRAASIVADVIDIVTEWDDDVELASLHTVAAFAFEGAGDVEAARNHLARARALHIRMNARDEIARDEWRIGTLMARAGQHRDALAQLEIARQRMLACGLKCDVISLDFDALEVSIAADLPAVDIAPLARRLAASSHKFPVNAAHAVAWLRSNAEYLDSETVRAVRQFVRDNQVYPSVAFVPPRRSARTYREVGKRS